MAMKYVMLRLDGGSSLPVLFPSSCSTLTWLKLCQPLW
jgi:hypothetical protein